MQSPSSQPDSIERQPPPKQVLVCQNRTCLKQGSAAVLRRFQGTAGANGDPHSDPLLSNESCEICGYEIRGCGCLGQCGNGPMVQVLPENIWYWQVQPDEVPAIIQKHLISGTPIAAMLYPPFHA